MKKLFQLTTIGLFIFLMPFEAMAFYEDVAENHQYYNPIKALYELQKLPEDTNFKPDDKLTNSNFYKLLSTFGGTKIATDENLNPANFPPKHRILSEMFYYLGIGTNYLFDKENFYFLDLDKNSPLSPIAQKASEIGIVEDKEDQQFFKMAQRLTNAQAADYLYKIYLYKNPDALEEKPNAINIITITETTEDTRELGTFVDVWNVLKNYYFYKEELDEEAMIYDAIEGLLKTVPDDYTGFSEPSEAEEFFDSLENEFEGIGIMIEMVNEQVTIISPLADSPAQKAGLLPNDIISKVDNESITGLNLDAVAKKIKGPAQTVVKITVLRNEKELIFEVTRQKITQEAVTGKIIKENGKKIAYIKLTTFGQDTAKELEKTGKELLLDNPKGFILDLRNNPGGYLNSAIEMVGLFLKEEKTVVKVKSASGLTEEYKSAVDGTLAGQKIVIIINKGSASASEILAGALQDHEIATLIGTISFGKGTVQNIKSYKDGSIFKYTMAKWLTPKDRDIDKIGLTPDKIIENDTATTEDEQLKAALAEF
ncbi:S41 family peptidase [Candidatus Peregrinibacteria bacterium]|nr:S41 family peptidase [Candidatus Peregrinibacteria bacterium]